MENNENERILCGRNAMAYLVHLLRRDEETKRKQLSVTQRWIPITFSGARWPYWISDRKSNTTHKTSS